MCVCLSVCVYLCVSVCLCIFVCVCVCLCLYMSQEQERQQRERNCHLLAKIFRKMSSITYRTTWTEVHACIYIILHVCIMHIHYSMHTTVTWLNAAPSNASHPWTLIMLLTVCCMYHCNIYLEWHLQALSASIRCHSIKLRKFPYTICYAYILLSTDGSCVVVCSLSAYCVYD